MEQDRGRSGLFIAGCVQASINYIISLSVRLCTVCLRVFALSWIARPVRNLFPQTRYVPKRRPRANAWDLLRGAPSRGGRGRRTDVIWWHVYNAAGLNLFSFLLHMHTTYGGIRLLCLIYCFCL